MQINVKSSSVKVKNTKRIRNNILCTEYLNIQKEENIGMHARH